MIICGGGRRATLRLLLPPLAGLALLAAAPGCDRQGVGQGASAPTTRRVVTTGPAGAGVARGVVSFKGTPPPGEDAGGSACHRGAPVIHVAPVEVGPGGGLRDVMVYVKDPRAVPSAAPGGPVVLDQVNCQYVPRVLGVRVGQVLRVRSSDPAMHNVHALSRLNPALNFGMSRPGETRDVSFAAPEEFTVKCDVHPWMSARVYVLDHPFFAVTGADGRFEITGLPAGECEVVFSHPFLGERTRKVTAADGAAAEVDVTFEKEK